MPISLSQFNKVRDLVYSKPFARKNYSRKKSLTLGYFTYRLRRPYLKYRYNLYQKAHPTEPWLCPDAIFALTQLLQSASEGLEYGSGRSTTFFAPYFESYVSIEHEEKWYNLVKEKLNTLPQVKYFLIEAEQNVPQQHLSSEQQVFMPVELFPVPDSLFKSYTDFILQFEPESFDFVLVDGRARTTCALNSIEKLKSGGLLVLDNSERARYKRIHEALASWPKIETTTGLTNTTIWRKP